MAGILTHNATLACSETKTGTKKTIANIQSFPSLGGTPSSVDTTCISDASRKSIPGLIDYGNLEFGLLYDNSGAESNFRVLKGFDDANKLIYWTITLPDGTKFEFEGYATVSLDGMNVDEAITFTLTVFLQSDIEATMPSGT